MKNRGIQAKRAFEKVVREVHAEAQRETKNPEPATLPPNCERVNGHLVCKNDDGLYDLFTAGVGWWGFNHTHEQAMVSARTVSAPTRGEGQ